MDVPKECLLSCDGFWLKEAMENVLKNAVEYADTGSLIQILLKEDTDYYKLYITNRGKRIEEEKRELIFDRFYQMEHGTGKWNRNWSASGKGNCHAPSGNTEGCGSKRLGGGDSLPVYTAEDDCKRSCTGRNKSYDFVRLG